MIRHALPLLLAGLCFSCASTYSSSYAIADADTYEAATNRRLEIVEAPALAVATEAHEVALPEAPAESVYTAAELAIQPAPVASAPLAVNTESYTMIKGGYYGSDVDEADAGYIFNAAFGRYLTSLFSAELEVGYFNTDGSDGGIDGEAWGIPVMLNGRVSLPLWILEVYAGLGVGAIYYDTEVGPFEDDGFVLGGNGFLGAAVGIGGIAVGLEAKYYVTEDVDDVDEGLDAVAVMLTVGFGG